MYTKCNILLDLKAKVAAKGFLSTFQLIDYWKVYPCTVLNYADYRLCVPQCTAHVKVSVHLCTNIVQTPDQDAVITGVVEGLPEGEHGFRIHQYGSFLGGTFMGEGRMHWF